MYFYIKKPNNIIIKKKLINYEYYNNNEIFVTAKLKPLPQKLSWSKINIYLLCPSCFYKEHHFGIKRPIEDYTAIEIGKIVHDHLKYDFDQCRKNQKPHQIMIENNINAVPFDTPLLETWRDAYKNLGVNFFDSMLNVNLFGAIDDIWINTNNQLILVEYKTSKKKDPILFLDTKNQWHELYKRQVAFYIWLLKKNKFNVNNVGYFIFCNEIENNLNLNNKLKFETSLIPYEIDDSWIPNTIKNALSCLKEKTLPSPSIDCKYCNTKY